MRNESIKIGEDYGYIRVTGLANKHYRCYTCKCLKCDREFQCNGHTVIQLSETGCTECRKKLRAEEYAAQCVGKRYGELEVLEFAGQKATQEHKKSTIVSCLCHKCGSITEVPLARLRAGQAKICQHCAKKYLDLGRHITSEASKGGTNVFALKDRKVNKNSKTGYTGVSLHAKTGKYRATIVFRRKQYYLGEYDKIKDAIDARKAAEEQIYGSFLEWYAKEYPEIWKRIKKKFPTA